LSKIRRRATRDRSRASFLRSWPLSRAHEGLLPPRRARAAASRREPGRRELLVRERSQELKAYDLSYVSSAGCSQRRYFARPRQYPGRRFACATAMTSTSAPTTT
jgi:hypothetical protein